MYIDGEFETNNDVEKGTEAHEKAAQRSDRIDVMEDIPEFESPPRNLIFYSEELMLSGALDAIKQRNGEWIPFEAKKSSAPDSQRPQHWHGFMLTPGAWCNDQVQVIGQMYILRGSGYSCSRASIYYIGSHTHTVINGMMSV